MQEPAGDPASLERLNDIVLPESAAWWPPAPGWYVLGAVLLIAGLLCLAALLRHWWKNRYRSAALRELSELRQYFGQSQVTEPREIVAGINRILKRTALVGWPRPVVGPLAGESWIAFLNQSVEGGLLSAQQASDLTDVAWSSQISQAMTDSRVNSLFDVAVRWIRNHQRPNEKATTGEAEVVAP